MKDETRHGGQGWKMKGLYGYTIEMVGEYFLF